MTTVPAPREYRKRAMRLWLAAGTALLVVGLVFSTVVGSASDARLPLLRVAVRVPEAARATSHPLVITLGGPVYCAQVALLVRYLRATLACPDYGLNGEQSAASRAKRIEDWGDPKYLDAVARLPRELERKGVKISELILVGASYSGYAAAELAATHPELRPRALIIVDSFLDLPARFRALLPGQPTRAEMVRVLGGTPAERPRTYKQRSPSSHLTGLAKAMRHGMRLLDVWSVATVGAREFNGGMCSLRSNAYWLRRLSRALHHPVLGYVTELRHAVALWDWWRQLLALAKLAPAMGALPATAITFQTGRPISSASYCSDASVALRLSSR